MKAEYVFKCECGQRFGGWYESHKEASAATPKCPLCGEHTTKRIPAFSQFTFKGGLPSNHGRDGCYR